MTAKHDLTNILFVHAGNDMYGADVILLELVKRLDRARFRPLVLLPADSKHLTRLSRRLQECDVEYKFIRMGVIRRKYFRPLGLIRFLVDFLIGIASITSIILRRQITLVHSNTLAVTAGAFAARITGRPHVWHIHEIIVDPVWTRRAVHSLIFRLSGTVVAVSNAVRDHLLSDAPSCAARVSVIHNGIDAQKFSPENAVSTPKTELGFGSDSVIVGMIGKVCRWKGQHQFLEAAKLVLRQQPDVRFVMVGGVFDDETFYMDKLVSAVASLGLSQEVQVRDFVPDIRNVLSAFDVFVLPSIQPDPFPTVLLEAMAMSKPVIATAHGGPTEMVVDDETGYLVPPRDAEALAAAILKLVDDPDLRLAMGITGRRRVLDLFSVERFVGDFERSYEEMMGLRAPLPVTQHGTRLERARDECPR